MTVREIWQQFGLPERAVRELLGGGVLPGRKVEGVWQVALDDALSLAEFLKRLRERRARHHFQAKSGAGQSGSSRIPREENERNRYGWD